MKWSVGNKIGAGFALALFILVIFAAVASVTTTKLVQTADLNRHTFQVLLHLKEVVSLLKDTETGQRGYIITGEDHYLEPYREAAGKIERETEEIRRLTLTNRGQQQRLITLNGAVT